MVYAGGATPKLAYDVLTEGARTVVGTGWQGMTALVTPGNWDRTGGNDVLARDSAGALWLYPGNDAGRLTTRRQVGSGWTGYTSPERSTRHHATAPPRQGGPSPGAALPLLSVRVVREAGVLLRRS